MVPPPPLARALRRPSMRARLTVVFLTLIVLAHGGGTPSFGFQPPPPPPAPLFFKNIPAVFHAVLAQRSPCWP